MKLNELQQLEHLLTESDCIITEDHLCEMARVKPTDSGLPFIIFVSTRDYGIGNHWARIKVSNIPGKYSKEDNFSISVDNPRVVAGKPAYTHSKVQDIIDWVKLNHDPLIKYWNDEYESDVEFYHDLKRL